MSSQRLRRRSTSNCKLQCVSMATNIDHRVLTCASLSGAMDSSSKPVVFVGSSHLKVLKRRLRHPGRRDDSNNNRRWECAAMSIARPLNNLFTSRRLAFVDGYRKVCVRGYPSEDRQVDGRSATDRPLSGRVRLFFG